MRLKYEKRLIDHLKHEAYEPATVDALAADLGIDDSEGFRAAVEDLAEHGWILLDNRDRVVLPEMGDSVEGVFRKNPRGFGFIITDIAYREGDLFVPHEGVGDALTGDRVRAKVERRMRRGEKDQVGYITDVLSRKRTNFTGELIKRGGLWCVFPDGKELTAPVVVQDPEVKNAKAGDKVVIELVSYPDGDELAEGVIVEVLGEAGLPDVETQAVIAAYSLPGPFDRECVAQARAATEKFDKDVEFGSAKGFDALGRLDLRNDFICTIDPPDAKDYDDAISITRTDDGGWELGVHIADVSHFIEEGSHLDLEAKQRGNSVYLPRLVIPMLPEVLSNGICSLSEGVERFCKSAMIRYDRNGKVVREGVAQTVIKSRKRLTYLEAQALIDGDLKEAIKHAKTEPKYSDQLIGTLREMDKCSRAIRQRRKEQGMIHLELPQVELVFDEEGRVCDAHPEDDAYTHTLIEMFMVEANEVLARLFEGLGVPLIRRVHPEPTPGDVNELRMAAKVAGFTIPKNPDRLQLQSLLDATAGTGAARAVHMAVLRTLTRAEYSPALIGHYALASEAYAHFTSPIRRYPDLTVHRALAAYLGLTDNGTRRPKSEADKKALGKKLLDTGAVPAQDELVEIGRHCTDSERNAADAEDSLRNFLVLQLLENHIGEQFDGIVTGVTNNGVWVQIEKYLVDGMIKSSDLPTGSQGHTGGRWQLDSRSGRLVHHQSGSSFGIGDRVKITIAEIDLPLRKLDLVISDPKARGAGKKIKLKGAEEELGGGGINLDWDKIKGRTGADKRQQRSKSRERGKKDYRQDRKQKGKRR